MARNLFKFLVVTTCISLFAFPLNSCFEKSNDEIRVIDDFFTIDSRLEKLNKQAKQTFETADKLINDFSILFDELTFDNTLKF